MQNLKISTDYFFFNLKPLLLFLNSTRLDNMKMVWQDSGQVFKLIPTEAWPVDFISYHVDFRDKSHKV